MRYAVARTNRAPDIGLPHGGKIPVACITTSVPSERTTTVMKPASNALILRFITAPLPAFRPRRPQVSAAACSMPDFTTIARASFEGSWLPSLWFFLPSRHDAFCFFTGEPDGDGLRACRAGLVPDLVRHASESAPITF